MRPTLLALLSMLIGLALVPYPGSSASAGCVAPWVSLDGEFPSRERVSLVRGEEVTVQGRAFVNGCDDTGGGNAFGCSGGDAGEQVSPMQDVELVVLQGQPTMQQTSLGAADAGTAEEGRLGWVTWTFTVPESLELGAAVIKTEGSEPLRVRIAG